MCLTTIPSDGGKIKLFPPASRPGPQPGPTGELYTLGDKTDLWKRRNKMVEVRQEDE